MAYVSIRKPPVRLEISVPGLLQKAAGLQRKNGAGWPEEGGCKRRFSLREGVVSHGTIKLKTFSADVRSNERPQFHPPRVPASESLFAAGRGRHSAGAARGPDRADERAGPDLARRTVVHVGCVCWR